MGDGVVDAALVVDVEGGPSKVHVAMFSYRGPRTLHAVSGIGLSRSGMRGRVALSATT